MKQNCHWWLWEFQWLIELLGVFLRDAGCGSRDKPGWVVAMERGWPGGCARDAEGTCEVPTPPPCPHPQLCRFQPERQTQRAALLRKGRGTHTSCFCSLTFSGASFTFSGASFNTSSPFLHHWPHLYRDVPPSDHPLLFGRLWAKLPSEVPSVN